MVIRLALIAAFFTTIITTAYVPASPISVPLDHWSYHFIERFQAKGILADHLSNTKPYTRDEVADMIVHISDLLGNGKISLSGVEEDQFEMLKKEFAPELTQRGVSEVTGYGHLLDWSGAGKKVALEVGYTQSNALKRGTEDYGPLRSTFQTVFWGDLAGGLFFYNDSRASYERTDEPLPLWDPYRIDTRYPWDAVSDSYLVIRFPWADLEIGKDSTLWGPGYHGVVGLAGVNPTFDVVRLPVQIGKAKFVSILGFLRDDLTKEHKSDVVRKYLSAHRVEIRLFKGFCIGWQEVYIYAEELHIELLNPIMPYQMAEDYLGDVGNNTMEGDIDLCIFPNTRLYASFFLDDFHPGKSMLEYGPNRWAALGGVLFADPFGLENSDFRFEYARIEPGVYPHKGIIQNPPLPLSYKHFNTPLGHWIGPNADDLFFEANYRFSKDLLATLSYSRIRKGEIGGSLYDYPSFVAKPASMEKKFLMGIVEKTNTVNLGLKYSLRYNSSIEFDYSHTRINNKQSEEAKLPGSDVRKQAWVTGRDWMQNVVQVTASLKY